MELHGNEPESQRNSSQEALNGGAFPCNIQIIKIEKKSLSKKKHIFFCRKKKNSTRNLQKAKKCLKIGDHAYSNPKSQDEVSPHNRCSKCHN
jgi:hypothetical protein